MKMRDSKGWEVCDAEFECHGSYDEGAYIVSAHYVECSGIWHKLRYYMTGKTCRCPNPVPDDELEYLTDAYAEECDEYAFESAVSAAESYYEGDR